MSIWSGVPGPGIKALNGFDEAARFHAEGDPTINMDVATTGLHDHIRLALYDDGEMDALCRPKPHARCATGSTRPCGSR
ncbi:hypothetical protein ABZ622_35725 [Streptomyces sp. NPDC007164]|uniref:hypothetical protein n=1 Tax=Streptomyces sp. NPDC007164 TaxID=3156918 RepID=UPI0033E22185